MTIKNLLVLAFLLGAGLGFGQFGEDRVITGCKLCSPSVEYSTDLNNDGYLDVIVITQSYDGIFWFKNSGNNSFSEPILISTGGLYVYKITIADFDADGDADIAFSGFDGKVYWFRNDGFGQFTEPVLLLNPLSVRSLHSADFDGDGNIDILLISRSSSGELLHWYRNEGDGFFSQSNTIQDLSALPILAIGDIDLDGDFDIIAGCYNDQQEIFAYKNNGEGIFIEEQLFTDNQRYNEIYLEDLDSDDDLDLVVSIISNNKSTLVSYKNNGMGNFGIQNIIISNLPVALSSVIVNFVNLDGDNDLDLIFFYVNRIIGNDFEIFIRFYENNGQGIFSDEKIILNELIDERNTRPSSVLTTDVSDDGYGDIFFARQEGIFLLENDRENEFVKTDIFRQELTYPLSVHLADIDGDEYQDLVVGDGLENRLVWYRNLGDGLFSSRIIISRHNTQIDEEDFYLTDLDTDGDIDILVSDADTILWHVNNGSGSFDQKKLPTALRFSSSVKAVDFDDDGLKDIVVADKNDEKIVWYKNFDNVRFSDENIISSGNSMIGSALGVTIQVGDIDNDGDNDCVFSAAPRPAVVSTFINDGTGNFTKSTIYENSSSGGVGQIHLTDLNNDNYLDLIVGLEQEKEVIWYRNDTNGTFVNPSTLLESQSGSRYFIDINTADIDGDNDKDVFVTGFTNNGIEKGFRWIENLGNGRFREGKFPNTRINRESALSIGDLDGDRDPDLVYVLGFFLHRIFWLENVTNFPSISGSSFLDENANGIYDSTETLINNQLIQLEPEATSSYTDANGTYRFYVPNGTYTLTVQPDSCYQITTDSLSYTVTIDGNVALNKNFGFQLASDYQHTQTRINSAPTRCGFDVPFSISVQNDGCVPSKGQYGLVLDSLVTLVETVIEPNEIKGDTLLWNYEELFSTQSASIQLTLQIAGTEFLGDFIQLTGLSYIENEAGELGLSSTYDYTSEIRCAYDPNDKLVYPNRLGDYDKNYTLFEEELEYTVRFQNTGTDTAFTVIIKDELDPNLNWKTFKPVVASHPHETLLHPDGLVEFTFKNILLPDSTTNEPLSHGFVTYKIRPNADLNENTNIENTANIFFDFNPPIQTNTTSNVLVEELPKITSTRKVKKTNFPIKVYPNPFEEVITFELEQFQPAVLEIFDARGSLVRTAFLQNRMHQETVSNLPSGLYFYRLLANTHRQLLKSGRIVKQ